MRWAAQSGIRAALMARGGFAGPRTVLEGTHGFYKAFAPSVKPALNLLMDGFGQEWVMQTIAFKPYACGIMTQPYIDCAIKLAESGVRADDIGSVVCKVGEGTVHRLWEPLAVKHRPPTPTQPSSARPIAWPWVSSTGAPALASSPRRVCATRRCWRWPPGSAT